MTRMPLFLVQVGLLGLAGCVNPQYTRVPQLAPHDPRAERQNFAYFDPYPDRETGPLTSGRPRGFDISRTETRKSQERAVNLNSAGTTSTSTWDYDRIGKYQNVVRP